MGLVKIASAAKLRVLVVGDGFGNPITAPGVPHQADAAEVNAVEQNTKVITGLILVVSRVGLGGDIAENIQVVQYHFRSGGDALVVRTGVLGVDVIHIHRQHHIAVGGHGVGDIVIAFIRADRH